MYKIWTVYEIKDCVIKYYVINVTTKQVQSVWNNLVEAKQVCVKLNVWIKEA